MISTQFTKRSLDNHDFQITQGLSPQSNSSKRKQLEENQDYLNQIPYHHHHLHPNPPTIGFQQSISPGRPASSTAHPQSSQNTCTISKPPTFVSSTFEKSNNHLQLIIKNEDLPNVLEYMISKHSTSNQPEFSQFYEWFIKKFELRVNMCTDIPIFKGRYFLGGYTNFNLESVDDGNEKLMKYTLLNEDDIQEYLTYLHTVHDDGLIFHNCPTFMETMIRRDEVAFPYVNKKIKDFVRCCNTCQIANSNKKQKFNNLNSNSSNSNNNINNNQLLEKILNIEKMCSVLQTTLTNRINQHEVSMNDMFHKYFILQREILTKTNEGTRGLVFGDSKIQTIKLEVTPLDIDDKEIDSLLEKRSISESIIFNIIYWFLKARFKSTWEYKHIDIYCTGSFTEPPSSSWKFNYSRPPVISVIPYLQNKTHWILFIIKHSIDGLSNSINSYTYSQPTIESDFDIYPESIIDYFQVKSSFGRKMMSIRHDCNEFSSGLYMIGLIEFIIHQYKRLTYEMDFQELDNMVIDSFNIDQYHSRVVEAVKTKGIRDIEWSLPVLYHDSLLTAENTPRGYTSSITTTPTIEEAPFSLVTSHPISAILDEPYGPIADESSIEIEQIDIIGVPKCKINFYKPDRENVRIYSQSDIHKNRITIQSFDDIEHEYIFTQESMDMFRIKDFSDLRSTNLVPIKQFSTIFDHYQSIEEKIILFISLLPSSNVIQSTKYVQMMLNSDLHKERHIKLDSAARLFRAYTQRYIKIFDFDCALDENQFNDWTKKIEVVTGHPFNINLVIPINNRSYGNSNHILLSYPPINVSMGLLYNPVWVGKAILETNNVFRKILAKFRGVHNIKATVGTSSIKKINFILKQD